MTNWNNRNRDLTEVFDARWKANHNDDIKNLRDKERKFINKLFNVKEEKDDFVRPKVKSSREIQLERLEKNMNNLKNRNNNFR